MSSRSTSRADSVYARGPLPEKRPALGVLHSRGRSMRGFIVACLRALLADPDGFLGHLDERWPPEGKAGRPGRTAAGGR